MDPQFEQVARIALAACGQDGFVLAGGNALLVQGIGDRLTHDVDLFTNVADPTEFFAATERVVQALADHGAQVRRSDDSATFSRLHVKLGDATDEVMVELAYDYRTFPPVTLDVGPVLDPRDALANKLCALYDRGAARDFIDVHRALESGVVASWQEALALGDLQSPSPLPRGYIRHSLERVTALDPEVLKSYGLSSADVNALQQQFARGVAALGESTPGVAQGADPRRLLRALEEKPAPVFGSPGREPPPPSIGRGMHL